MVGRMLTSRELSTGFPLPLPIPHAHRKIAQVMAAPIRMASTVPISGKVVMRYKKYMLLEIMEADTASNPIYDKLAKLRARRCEGLPSMYPHPPC